MSKTEKLPILKKVVIVDLTLKLWQVLTLEPWLAQTHSAAWWIRNAKNTKQMADRRGRGLRSFAHWLRIRLQRPDAAFE